VGDECVLTLDATKSPKEYVLTIDATKEPQARVEFRGIYRLRGDTLTFCSNDGSESRPESFDGSKRGRVLQVYKRAATR
jgi:uncharacterized protein (TIGR03067 family)